MLNLPDISFLARWVLDSYISQTYFISLQTASDRTHRITVAIIIARHEDNGSGSVSVATIMSRC
jgi:hypothetical protein